MTRLLSAMALIALLPAAPAQAHDCAEGMRHFAHPGGETCIPVDPQRIVTLQDQNGLLPLLELGLVPVGSAGHVLPDGTPIFRRTEGFDTSAVAFVGSYAEPDVEAVAALAPDLIIASTWPAGQMETYSAIAPTIVFDPFAMPLDEALLQIADAVGRRDRALELQAEVEARAAEIRDALGPDLARTTASFLSPDLEAGLIYPVEPAQAAGLAFDLLGLVRPPAQAAMAPTDVLEVGLESLPEHQGDVIFVVTYEGEAQGEAVDAFLASPLVTGLPAAKADQIVALDGTQVVGAAWSRVRTFMDEVAAVLGDDPLDRDLVAE